MNDLEDKLKKPHCEYKEELQYQVFMRSEEKKKYNGLQNAYCLCSATQCPYYASNGVQEFCKYNK